ncbi:MAG: GIY-YIG nuclease family protein [Cyanobacteriota bacterium]|nr:GIY-YIG nuclease family protein [Cyanobacteriota bacterium]
MDNECITLLIMNHYNGLKKATLDNWDGVAYIGERKHIPTLQKIEQLSYPGIYFLIGNYKETNEKVLYVGKSNNLANRLQTHNSDHNKDWFESFVAFTSKNGDLNSSHAEYLEADFIELAQKNAGSITLDNSCGSNVKKDGKLTDMYMPRVEGYKKKALVLINNLNLLEFMNTGEEKTPKQLPNGDVVFTMNLKRNNKDKVASLEITENGYKLVKGSYVAKDEAPYFSGMSAYKKRNELIDKGLLQDIGDIYITTEDIYFKSPSGASDVVAGSSTNGRTEWKLENGTTLDAYEQRQ